VLGPDWSGAFDAQGEIPLFEFEFLETAPGHVPQKILDFLQVHYVVLSSEITGAVQLGLMVSSACRACQ
jgi:hypothetical protein